jgi:hypothetical protein
LADLLLGRGAGRTSDRQITLCLQLCGAGLPVRSNRTRHLYQGARARAGTRTGHRFVHQRGSVVRAASWPGANRYAPKQVKPANRGEPCGLSLR